MQARDKSRAHMGWPVGRLLGGNMGNSFPYLTVTAGTKRSSNTREARRKVTEREMMSAHPFRKRGVQRAGVEPRFCFAPISTFAYSQNQPGRMSNTLEAAPPLTMREVRLSSGMPRWQGIVLLLLTAWLYAAILTRLFLQWVGPSSDPNFHTEFLSRFLRCLSSGRIGND